jgi:hypothetical protein
MLAMANAVYEQSQIYSPRKLDQPDRMKLFLKHTGDILEALPDSKEKADLGKKILAALKDAPK